LKFNKNFYEIGGKTLLSNIYNGEFFPLLANVYPDYQWLPWRFASVPKSIWEDQKIQRKFMDWAVTEMSDWHKMTQKVGKNSIFKLKFNRTLRILEESHFWNYLEHLKSFYFTYIPIMTGNLRMSQKIGMTHNFNEISWKMLGSSWELKK
jgi:hypothetical protein